MRPAGESNLHLGEPTELVMETASDGTACDCSGQEWDIKDLIIPDFK